MRGITGIAVLSALLVTRAALADQAPWLYSVSDQEQAIGCFDQAHEYVLANYRQSTAFKSWDALRAAQPVKFDEFMAQGGCQYYDSTTHWEELASDGHVAMMRLYPFTSWPQTIVYFEPEDLLDRNNAHPRLATPQYEASPHYEQP